MSDEQQPQPVASAPKRRGSGRVVAVVIVLALVGAGALFVAAPGLRGGSQQGFHAAAAGTPTDTGLSDDAASPPSAGDPAPSGAWTVTDEKESPISDQAVPVARMSQTTSTGGRIDVKATCPDDHSVTFEFDSFDGDGKGLAFEYSQPNDNGERYLDIIYRLNSGHQLLLAGAFSNSRYVNRGVALFTAVGADYEPADIDKANAAAGTNGGSGNNFLKALSGSLVLATLAAQAMQAQDLNALLTAKRVRFQFPLEGGRKEIVEFAPNDGSFRDFLSRCHTDPALLTRRASPPPQPDQPPPSQAADQPPPQPPADQNGSPPSDAEAPTPPHDNAPPPSGGDTAADGHVPNFANAGTWTTRADGMRVQMHNGHLYMLDTEGKLHVEIGGKPFTYDPETKNWIPDGGGN